MKSVRGCWEERLGKNESVFAKGRGARARVGPSKLERFFKLTGLGSWENGYRMGSVVKLPGLVHF